MATIDWKERLKAERQRAEETKAVMEELGCKTVEEFAGRTGVPIETAESWLAGKNWPKRAHIALQIMRELRAKRSGSFYDRA